jgi:hypothetical protein
LLPPAASAGATGSAASAASRPATTDAAAAEGDDDEDSRTCVVCLSEPRNAGLLHGSTVHKVCCRNCAIALMQAAASGRGGRGGGPARALCPVCRAPVERVLDIF